MKKTRNRNLKRIITSIFVASFLMFFAASYTLPQTAWAASADKKDIVIEVVEDIPADTIEDEQVPLAATPATATGNGMRVGIPVAVAVAIVLTGFYARNRRARAEVRLYQE